MSRLPLNLSFLALAAVATAPHCSTGDSRHWLAGDSHVHSHWSPGYERSDARIGRHATYATHLNARMARKYGLAWMVTTDHGGPNHSRLNLEKAYPELVAARDAVPELLQFYGMELNMPGMGHHTVIMPRAETEQRALFQIESRFDVRDVWPYDPVRDTATVRIQALEYMRALPLLPLVLANHPQRDATGIGAYGINAPWEIRSSNDLAPEVYRGMEGGPGHQAGTLAPDGRPNPDHPGHRANYASPGALTLGGYDQMTAIVGGFWDALLGEGRQFWIVATSDSHVNYADPHRSGDDFWPGEFHKTYVHARPEYGDVVDGLRQGRVFAVAGDLITELDVTASVAARQAAIGSTLTVRPTDEVRVDRGGPRNSDRLLRWDPDQGEGVWHATEETELSC